MALDGKVLARAKRTLADRRKSNEDRHESRLIRAYEKNPRIRELDLQLRLTMLELAGFASGLNGNTSVEDIHSRNIQLQNERKSELVRAGFSENYLDEQHVCEKCGDTGFAENAICDCLNKLYKEEQKASLTNLFKLGDETFDNFNLLYYDETLTTDFGVFFPRESMKIVFDTCVEYAHKFGEGSQNLLFLGATGLGKTYLSACIARVVAESGYSVVYDMATVIFSKFEDVKFSRTDDLEDKRDEIKRYLECDLLIIDDLGTELVTAFTIATLYEVINTRLITGKSTIVSSNFTVDDLYNRYSEQIASRLEGEYHVLKFYGDDVRKKKNMV